jgi:hypothetical protein
MRSEDALEAGGRRAGKEVWMPPSGNRANFRKQRGRRCDPDKDNRHQHDGERDNRVHHDAECAMVSIVTGCMDVRNLDHRQ